MSSTPAAPHAGIGVVTAVLDDGREVLAEYDGCEWWMHQDSSPDAVILPGDRVVDWKRAE